MSFKTDRDSSKKEAQFIFGIELQNSKLHIDSKPPFYATSSTNFFFIR